MAMIRKTVGTGITASETVTWTDPDGADAADVAAAIARSTLKGRLAEIEAECIAVMSQAGLPFRQGARGNWKAAEARGYEPDDAAGFAARMLDDCADIRAALVKCKHERAAMFAFYLGMKFALRTTKGNWEKAAVSGKKSLDGAASTRKGSMSDLERMIEVDRLISTGMRKKTAYHIDGDREGTGWKAIETAYRRAKTTLNPRLGATSPDN